MANPQKEQGFTGVANELWDAIFRARLPGSEYQVLGVIIRETYGWNRKLADISMAKFCTATNISSRQYITHVIQSLESKKIIVVTRNHGKMNSYQVNKDYEKWSLTVQNNLTSQPDMTSHTDMNSDQASDSRSTVHTGLTSQNNLTSQPDMTSTVQTDITSTSHTGLNSKGVDTLLHERHVKDISKDMQSCGTSDENSDTAERDAFYLFEEYWGCGRVNPQMQTQLKGAFTAYGVEIVTNTLRKALVARPKNFWAWMATVCAEEKTRHDQQAPKQEEIPVTPSLTPEQVQAVLEKARRDEEERRNNLPQEVKDQIEETKRTLFQHKPRVEAVA